MWSTAAFDGAHIIILRLLSVFLRYSYCAESKPINVEVLPVPGGPCSKTNPLSLSTISLIDCHWVSLNILLRWPRISSNTYFLSTITLISFYNIRGSRTAGASSEYGRLETAKYYRTWVVSFYRSK